MHSFIHILNIYWGDDTLSGAGSRPTPRKGWGARSPKQVQRGDQSVGQLLTQRSFQRLFWGQMAHLQVVRTRAWPRGLGLLLAPKGAVTTCPKGNHKRCSPLRCPRVGGEIRQPLRLHSAPPLPLFSSDAAVEAAAAAASPAARGAPTRSRNPDFLFL